MMNYPPGIVFSRQHERLLHKTVVDENGPGTVLHDFEAFLTFVEEGELPLTGTHQLPRRVLADLNARLAHPLQIGLTRPLQKSYPHVHGLYLLLRASGLTLVEGTDRKPLLVVDDAVRQVWNSLNPTERYCTLLETWLVRGHPQIIGERGRGWFRVPETFREVQWFFHRLPDDGLPVAGNKEAEDSLRYWPGLHNLALLELFGLVTVRHGPPESGKGWCIEMVERTPLGDALLAALHAGFFGDVDNLLAPESEDKVPFGVLQQALQPYFPAWRKNLSVREWAFREDAHVFKVSLGRIWRRIAIPARLTLDDLASAILNAVQFDHDHLYQFRYRNRFGVEEQVQHPNMDDGPWTDEVQIGDVPLRLGQTMTFLYDFGDRWEFEVTLESVNPEMAIKKPAVLEKQGNPPEQYGW
jgi:hypothetical protein